MKRSSVLPLLFAAALSVEPASTQAQSTETEVERPTTAQGDAAPASAAAMQSVQAEEGSAESDAQTVLDSKKAEITTVDSGPTETSLPMTAIAAHVAAFRSFIQKQAIDPTVELTNSSLDVAGKSIQWAIDGSAQSLSWAWDGSNVTVSWVLDGSSKSLRWVWDGSTGTLKVAVDGIGTSVRALSDKVAKSAYWPANAMDKFVEHMHSEGFEEFAELVDDTGFAIAEVEVSIGIIPDLAVEFKHERDLTKEELDEVENKIMEYISRQSKSAGYIESVILHNLVEAGKISARTDLSGVTVKLFPFPGLVLSFDPFGYEEREAEEIKSAFVQSNINANTQKELEKQERDLASRIEMIEAAIKKLHSESLKKKN